MANRPNVLFLMVDQCYARCLGVEGHPDVQTPNLDRLAASAVRFRHAYVQNPICTPSRMCYLSSQYAHNIDYYGLDGPNPAFLPNAFAHFKAHGYVTGAVGKIHTPVGWIEPSCDYFREAYVYDESFCGSHYEEFLRGAGREDDRDDDILQELAGTGGAGTGGRRWSNPTAAGRRSDTASPADGTRARKAAELPVSDMQNWPERVFFGLHYDLYAELTDTELGKEVTPERLRNAWQQIKPDWIQCDCKGHPGYTSWPTKVGTPSPGIVRDALRIHRDVTRELGIPLVVHYSGVWDTAAVQQHPEWARVNADGQRDPDKACLTGGYTADLMVPQFLEIIDRYDVDGFWVDGDNWASAPCYCERCLRQFADELPGATAPRGPAEAGWPAWHAFHRRAFEAHVRLYCDAVHQRKPSCLVCSNWLYSLRQPEAVSLPVDFLSGDFSHALGPGASSGRGAFSGQPRSALGSHGLGVPDRRECE